jgi:hypothetical protein
MMSNASVVHGLESDAIARFGSSGRLYHLIRYRFIGPAATAALDSVLATYRESIAYGQDL